MRKFSILLIILLIFISCCNSSKKNENNDDKNIIDYSTTAYIIINGRTFYMSDFLKFADIALKEMSGSDLNNESVKKYLIDNFIEHKLLLQEAIRRNVQIDEKKIYLVTNSFLSETGIQDLKVYSGSFNTNGRDLADMLRERSMVETLIYDYISSKIEIKEDEIRKKYNALYGQGELEEKTHLFQIFTTDKDVADKALAELNKGIAFAEVASRYSEGPEKSEGGDLGFISKETYPEIFAEAFKLKEGEISNIVKSEYGYHIFLVQEYSTPKQADYNSVKTQIHFSLYNKEQNKKIRELVHSLYEKADIQYVNDIDLSTYADAIKSRSNR